MNHILFKKQKDHWGTPDNVYESLNVKFNFDFDPCPLAEIPLIDGLAIEWKKSNFVNPPFSQMAAWCKKSYEESLKGKTVVMLIASRTDTKYWHDFIMKADEIWFIKGRLKFKGAESAAPFPSCVVVFNRYGENNMSCKIVKIRTWDLKNGVLS